MPKIVDASRKKKKKTFKIDDATTIDAEISANEVVFYYAGKKYAYALGNFESVCIPHPSTSDKHICFEAKELFTE
jgi:hypothetical protein